MAFSHFKNIQQVIQKYPLRIKREGFLPDTLIELPTWNFGLISRLLIWQNQAKAGRLRPKYFSDKLYRGDCEFKMHSHAGALNAMPLT